MVHASLIIAHSSSLDTALAAAQAAGLPSEHVITFDESNQMTVDTLIQRGLRSEPNFVERRLRKGEAKTKVAFLSFSSGTTGKPKVRVVPPSVILSELNEISLVIMIGRCNITFCSYRERDSDG